MIEQRFDRRVLTGPLPAAEAGGGRHRPVTGIGQHGGSTGLTASSSTETFLLQMAVSIGVLNAVTWRRSQSLTPATA